MKIYKKKSLIKITRAIVFGGIGKHVINWAVEIGWYVILKWWFPLEN